MAGRPTKYKPEYCDLLIERAREGASLTEFCAEIGITRQTLHNWKDAHSDFFDAYIRAETEGRAYWERWLRTDGITDRNVNAPLVKLYLANRFGMSDKQSVDHTSSDGSMKPQRIEIVSGGNSQD